MCQNANSGWIVSDDELKRLTDLFLQFEGAPDPLSNKCKESESEFNSLVEKIYQEKVRPAYNTIGFSQFRSFTRNRCRLRLSKEGPPFPCL